MSHSLNSSRRVSRYEQFTDDKLTNIYIISIAMKAKIHQASKKITQLTLVSWAIGILTVMFSPYLGLLMLLVWPFPKFFPFTRFHEYDQIANFTRTTFVFGIINGFALSNIIEYFTTESNSAPLFSVYAIITTIYHYFEFQLVNNYHHK